MGSTTVGIRLSPATRGNRAERNLLHLPGSIFALEDFHFDVLVTGPYARGDVSQSWKGNSDLRSSLISLRVAAVLLLILAAANLRAGDGTTDLRLNPAATTTISTPGSYILVGSVTMATGIGAIVVTANNVTIDLNGHTIYSAGGGGSADGIGAGAVVGLRVHNGTVFGFTGAGLNCNSTAAASIHDVRVSGCTTGITVGTGSVIRDCVVTGCFGHGIITSDRSLVEGCNASGNNTMGGSAGIYVGSRSTVRNCVASNNSGTTNTSATGIRADNGCTLEGNTCDENNGNGSGSGTGMQTGSKCAILRNTVADNTGGADGRGTGISAGEYCTVRLNTVTNNDGGGGGAGTGIQGGNYCTVTNNTANDNDAGASGNEAYGIYVSSSCTISGNTCNENQEGSLVVGTSFGIRAAFYCLVENNTCGNNDAITDGGARGILAGMGCTVRNNNCSLNDAQATGISAGIEAGADCHVEGNTCSTNTDGASSYGIRITGADSTVIRNVTANNGSGGISWSAAGFAGRCEQNRMGWGDGVIINPPTSVGAGDLANVDF